MATIIQGKNPRKPYTVRYWVAGKQRERSFATRAEAEAFKTAPESVNDGDGETFRQYATRWLEQTARVKTFHTLRDHETVLRLHLFPVFGDMPLTAITREQCKNVLCSPDLTSAQAEHMKQTLCAVLNEAVRDKRITENPAYGIKTPPRSLRADLIPVTYRQLEIIEGELLPAERLALWVMLGCGVRLGEVLAVKVEGIRDDGKTLRVEEQVYGTRRKSDPVIGPLKARQAGDYRDVPLANWVREMIEDHCKRLGIREGYLFPAYANGITWPSKFSRRFKRGCAKAGVPEFHAHALRHLYVSQLLAGGIPIDSVARFVGHKNIALTYSVYGHLMPSSAVRAREASDNAMQAFKAA